MESLSAPVDVIVPFDVVGVTGSGDTIRLFELLHIPELFNDDVIDEPKRATRLLALAVIRLLRSSRSSDFNGDTWTRRRRRRHWRSLCKHFDPIRTEEKADGQKKRVKRNENKNGKKEGEH